MSSIIFYAIDSVGIGHLSRTLAVAQEIYKINNNIPIIFLSEVDDTRLLRSSPFPYFSVTPYHALLYDKRWHELGVKRAESIWIAQLSSLIDTCDPSVFVFDSVIWPPIYNALPLSCRKVLILRQRPDTEAFLAENDAFMKDLDLIVLPHHESEFALPLNHGLRAELFYSGPIVRRTTGEIDDPDYPSRHYQMDHERFNIVVTNGGGNALLSKADNFLDLVIEAISLIQKDLPLFHVFIFTGPLQLQPFRHVEFKNGRVTIREFDIHLLEVMMQADVVIARGGYNTVLEISHVGVSAICVAASRNWDNQIQRIKDASDTANITVADLDVNEIGLAILSILSIMRRGSLQKHTTPNSDELIANKHAIARKIIELYRMESLE